jgi:hypothetical protein
MVMNPSQFKPGHALADLTRVQSIDVLDPLPLEPTFEIPNCAVVNPDGFNGKGWACALHGFSQDFHLVGSVPGGPSGRGPVTRVHCMTIVIPNPLYGTGHAIAGRWLRKCLAAEIFEMAFSDSQDSEVWYMGKPNLNRMNYANAKLIFNRIGERVYLNWNGNWKWQNPGWQGTKLPQDAGIPAFNVTLNIPAWQQGKPTEEEDFAAVEVDNLMYWPWIGRNATGHIIDHHGPQAWLPYDQAQFNPAGVIPHLPRAAMTWEPDAALMSNLPTVQLGRYLALHGL